MAPVAKQTVAEVDDPYALTPEHLREWYFGPYRKMDAHLKNIRKSLIEDKGVSSELAMRATSREKLPIENRYEEVLKLSINKNNNRFFSLKDLEERGDISQEQANEIRGTPEYYGYNNGEPPFFYFSHIERVFDKDYTQTKKSWLVANLLFEGLTAKGQRINKATTIGYHAIPRSSSTSAVQDPQSKETVELPVYPQQQLDPFSELNRVYDIEYSRETLDAMLRHALPGCALAFTKIGSGKHFAAKNIDNLLTEDIDALIKEFTAPKPTNEYHFNLSAQDLADFKRYQQAKEEQGETHYQ